METKFYARITLKFIDVQKPTVVESKFIMFDPEEFAGNQSNEIFREAVFTEIKKYVERTLGDNGMYFAFKDRDGNELIFPKKLIENAIIQVSVFETNGASTIFEGSD